MITARLQMKYELKKYASQTELNILSRGLLILIRALQILVHIT